MKKNTFFNIFKYKFLKIIQLQLFISIISLPILICWGLPISLMSPIGNILFTPILAIFLFLSSIIFFFELFYIPNQLIIELLSLLTNIWLKIFSFGTFKWLVTFPLKAIGLLFLIPILAFGILQNKYVNNINNSIYCFTIILLASGIFFKRVLKNNNNIEHIANINKSITLINKNNKIIVVDHGNLSRTSTPSSFIEYTLLPQIIKKYGHCNIDTFITKLNKRSIDGVKFILSKTSISNIYFLAKKVSFISEDYKNLKDYTEKNGIVIKIINENEMKDIINKYNIA